MNQRRYLKGNKKSIGLNENLKKTSENLWEIAKIMLLLIALSNYSRKRKSLKSLD